MKHKEIELVIIAIREGGITRNYYYYLSPQDI